MAFPVSPVILPTDLTNQSNGKLTSPPLVPFDFPGRGTGRLHSLAARAFRAFAAECHKATGVVLTVTSKVDAYRDFTNQWNTWFSRYRPVSMATYYLTPSSRRKRWIEAKSYGQDSTYWVKVQYPNGQYPAGAANPGKSNHGWGLALDICEWTGTGVLFIGNSRAWGWVLANATRFGFSWEDQTEAWHIRYISGNSLPAAVLAFENPTPQPPPIGFAPELGVWGLWPLNPAKPPVQLGSVGDAVKYLQGVLKLKANQTQISVDGKFGPQTRSAVVQFQAFMGLLADGIVGPKTWAAIDLVSGR